MALSTVVKWRFIYFIPGKWNESPRLKPELNDGTLSVMVVQKRLHDQTVESSVASTEGD